MAGSERPTPVPRAPRQGRLAPQHARVPAQRHSPTHVHVLAHVQQAIHELGRELLSLSLSLLFALFLPPPLPSLDRRSPIPESQSSLSRYEPHLCALYPPPPAFSHVYRTRYILLTLLDFSGNSLLLFYDFTRADGLNNTGEAVLLSFG